MSDITQGNLSRSGLSGSLLLLLRQLVPLTIVAIALWFLKDKFTGADLGSVRDAVAQVTFSQWVGAVAATGVSFCAVGRYDAVLHGVLSTNISKSVAQKSGAVAIAIAQFTGFGALTGALVRWRLLRNVSLWQATRISLAVSTSFVAGWAVITAIVIGLAGYETPIMQIACVTVLSIFVGLVLLSLLQPCGLTGLPPVRAMLAVLALTTIDTFFAGAAFWSVLPSSLNISMVDLLPIFLLAFGAGLLGGTPGGLGSFELMLLALLPTAPAEPLLVAALAFRLVYYVLPALLAVVYLFLGSHAKKQTCEVSLASPAGPFLPPQDENTIWVADFAEVNLVRQRRFVLLKLSHTPIALLARTGQSLVLLTAPFTRKTSPDQCLKSLSFLANSCHRAPFVHKCLARIATIARAKGWAIVRVGQQAWIRPADFSLDGSQRRQLRRMIRKARSAGATITPASHPLPLERMREISNQWVLKRGAERGFSMGVLNRIMCSASGYFWPGMGLI